MEKVVLVVNSFGAEVEAIVAYMRDIRLTEYDFHIRTVHLDNIKVLFIHQLMRTSELS